MFALENEFAPWRAKWTFRTTKWGSAAILAAKWRKVEVGVLLTGVGRSHAARKIAEVGFEAKGPIDFVVSTGLAGGLRPEYKIGQVLAAKSVLIAGTSGRVQSSAHLMNLARECGATAVDSFISADHVATSADEKLAMGVLMDAVEMESFDVLSWAADAGIPAIAVRAISDTSQEDMPIDMNRVLTADGDVSLMRVFGEVARRPGSIPGLMRLGRRSRIAAESLALFLNSFMQKLDDLSRPVETEVAIVHG